MLMPQILVQNIIHDNKLVIRQNPEYIRCEGYFNGIIHKSTTSNDDIPANSINVKLIVEYSSELPTPIIESYSLQKRINGQWVNMDGVTGPKSLGYLNKATPQNPGWFIIQRYSLSASPSECTNAPIEGILGNAEICVTFTVPIGGFISVCTGFKFSKRLPPFFPSP